MTVNDTLTALQFIVDAIAEDSRGSWRSDDLFEVLNSACGEIASLRAALAEAERDEWRPIETAPDAVHILLYWPSGEKGNGQMECATTFRDSKGNITSFWTNGGPNSGVDWDPTYGLRGELEFPTHWRPLPDMPT